MNKISGIDGNLVRFKGIGAIIPIGNSYRAGLMDLIKNKMV